MTSSTTMNITLVSKDGYSAVQDIIKLVSCLISERKEMDDIFPQFIFRGITRYDKNFENGTKDISEWTIRSGLAIRMSESYSEGFNKNDFVAELIDLVQKARKQFPNVYADYFDLEILADIQHNGGATCLVDFSKNLLTALWFACSNENDDNKDGFLFCYNIIEDVKCNNLEYLNPTMEEKEIKTVLLNTYRYTNYSQENIDKFCLWEPSNINDRIVRQDSVFLFGTESFVIGEHDIFTICIPHGMKKFIRESLSVLFNISSENMYKDRVGLANSNAKCILMPNALNLQEEKAEDEKLLISYKHYLSVALAYINKGNCQSALSQLKICEQLLNEMESVIEFDQNHRKIELYFYLGTCYKKLNFLDNAIVEFEKVKKMSLEALNDKKCIGNNEEQQKRYLYYSKKCIQAYNILIDILYDRHFFRKAFAYCKDLMDYLNVEKVNFVSGFDARVTELSILELCVLTNLYQKTEEGDRLNYTAKKMPSSDKDDTYINYLALYYKTVLSLLCEDKTVEEYKNGQKILENDYYRILHSKNPLKNYIEWTFSDMQEALEKMPKESKDEQEKYRIMSEMLALVISVRDMFRYLNDKARN